MSTNNLVLPLLTKPTHLLRAGMYAVKPASHHRTIMVQWSYCALSQTKTKLKTKTKRIRTVTRASPAQLKSCDWGSSGKKQPAIRRGHSPRIVTTVARGLFLFLFLFRKIKTEHERTCEHPAKKKQSPPRAVIT